MKFEVEKMEIENAVQKISRVAGKHLTLPVLSCVHLESSSENTINIKATNLDLGVEMKLKSKNEKIGKVVVPAGIFLNTLSSIKDGKVYFEEFEGNLKINTGKNNAVIKCMPSEDFPTIPKLENKNALKINIQDLILGFRSVWYSASNSNIKPELGSIFIYQNGDGLTFVSTDSFRLAEKRVNTKITEDFPQVLIPYKNVSEIIKIFEDYQGLISIVFEKNQASFFTDNIYVVSRLVDGSFPDYKQIIPKNYITSALVLKNDFLTAIKTSNIFADTLNQVKLKIAVKEKNFILESKNKDIGEYKESLNASLSGDDIELNFNSRYIVDCIQSITSDSLQLNFGGSGKPLVISGVSDKSFIYIVMPMNR